MELKEKYEFYKRRFFKSFIAVDDPKIDGTNLPAYVRQLWGKSGFICWGDTTIDMAYYIMYLSSEYYNYTKEGNNDADETLKKLYYALKSLERLDHKAEYNYRKLNIWNWDKGPKPEDLNGFFIRDDVPKDFLKKYTLLTESEGYNYVDKAAGFWYNEALFDGIMNYRMNEMSQDQVWHLVLGFAFSKKILEKLENKTYTIDGVSINISDFITKMSKRILDYMFITCNQKIKNPVYNKEVPRGSDMTLMAYGFAEVGKYLTGYDYSKHLKWYQKYLYKIVFGLSENVFYTKLIKYFPKIQIKDYSYKSFAVIANVDIFNNIKKMIESDALKTNYIHFPYIYKLLHDVDFKDDIKKLTLDLLKDAPENGPYNFTNDIGNIRWSVSNTLIHRNEELGDKYPFNGVYPGLDFLLMYNLYKLFDK